MGSPEMQFAALELYLRRIYPLHNLKGLEATLDKERENLMVKFLFFNDFFDGAGMRTATSVTDLSKSGAAVAAASATKPLRTGLFLKCSSWKQFLEGGLT